ncbi:oxidoreductase [Acuticoccus sediminis]|uniref:Oxidoreductase n=1 Tax=Acuticoccus sediminis TaxID=2184697 RepID=A0A8B2NM53_9HYPH|nr:Gfo/Idh/MocA family oxidoreductase [Acuticoccus sediminis]RAH97666.1 oxidoreductase [Acuticoccus sediminis]
MQALHIASIGAGSFGRHHARHLSQHPLVGKVTIVDQDEARAAGLAAEHGTAWTSDIASISPDAAVIAVPTEAHRAIAEPLIGRGASVFIEKPIAGSDADAAALVAAAERAGVVLQVGHIERFNPAFAVIAEGANGVTHIAARRHNPPRPTPPTADVVLDLMIHDIDLALTLAGQMPRTVNAFAPDGGAESAVASLHFANGITADLSASRLSPVTERVLTVHDADGVWRADLAAGRLARTAHGAIVSDEPIAPRDNLFTELDEFVRAVLGGPHPTVTGRAGAAALAVAERIRAAIASPSFQLSA